MELSKACMSSFNFGTIKALTFLIVSIFKSHVKGKVQYVGPQICKKDHENGQFEMEFVNLFLLSRSQHLKETPI